MQQITTLHKNLYYAALILAFTITALTAFFTFENTYDAFVHIFFADHYANDWFNPWDLRWYTGFTLTSYPPLIHQVIALFSKLVGLKIAFVLTSAMVSAVLVRGVFQFSRIWVPQKIAILAAFLSIFCTCIGEAQHIFGQLPSLAGSALLLNATYEVYRWIRFKNKYRFGFAVLLLAVTSACHHVTTIFGAVFIMAPVVAVAIYDRTTSNGQQGNLIINLLKSIWSDIPRLLLFAVVVLLSLITIIFPYWYWSATDPITQVSIPHGSRDNFLQNEARALVFFVIPWGLMLFGIPFYLRSFLNRRFIPLACSFLLLFILGLGGTTSLPIKLLGENAFNILTFDRFTYWCVLITLPIWAAFVYKFTNYFLPINFNSRFKKISAGAILALVWIGIIGSYLPVAHLSSIIDLQPNKIETAPITSFLKKDYHSNWRYMTLGFGDQFAWLSTQTDALSVDGNYHSARRLPELTARAVERLENAKYQGEEGLSALRQFLSKPDKYHLKFIFSNDAYYDPALFFYGWNKLQRLENGVVVWEKPDIKPLPQFLKQKEIPKYQKIMWGVLPISALAFLLFYYLVFRNRISSHSNKMNPEFFSFGKNLSTFWAVQLIWMLGVILFFSWASENWIMRYHKQNSPMETITSYYHWVDFKKFELAANFLDPEGTKNEEQFLLEKSIQSGMMSSYAKMEDLEILELKESENEAKVVLKINWQTAIRSHSTIKEHKLVKRSNKWYVVADPIKFEEAPHLFLSQSTIGFHREGSRVPIAGVDRHRDQHDRPMVQIVTAKMIEKDSNYHIIGEIVNLDNYPAHLTIQANIYAEGKLLYESGAGDEVNYRLLPKERTFFKLNLSEYAKENNDLENPSSFTLYVKSLVSNYTDNAPISLELKENKENSNLIWNVENMGVHEILIPQIQMGFVQSNELRWVDVVYPSQGVKPQKKISHTFTPATLKFIREVYTAPRSRLFVNGAEQRQAPFYDELTPTFQNETIPYEIRAFATGMMKGS